MAVHSPAGLGAGAAREVCWSTARIPTRYLLPLARPRRSQMQVTGLSERQHDGRLTGVRSYASKVILEQPWL
jgi:hypothetical protein